MIFMETTLPGAFVVELTPHCDERGFFARSFCRRVFAERGLHSEFVQCNVSYNDRRGTLRGMHYQVAPFAEVKLVSCTAGEVFDVIVDLRPESAAYRKWFGVNLSATNHKMLYIPAGCAHGFVTLADASEVFYQMGDYYNPDAARGFRWDDSHFKIHWPMEPEIASRRDRSYADFEPVIVQK